MTTFGWFIVGALTVCGQTLRVTGVTGAPGENVTVEISLTSPSGGRAPAALQWDMIFPAQMMEIAKPGPEAGHAAKDSGKSLNCAEKKAYSYVCLLAGGQKPIPNGPIAIFHFRILENTRRGVTTIRIEKAEGVTPDLKRFTLSDAEGTVTIR